MKILNQAAAVEPLNALTPHPANPRRGHLDAISDSIREHGFYGAVVAQRSTGHILAGNHRWQAAQAAGATEIPVIWVDVNDDEALRILLVDNRTNDLATYDDHALLAILNDLNLTPAGLTGTGYDDNALKDLLEAANTLTQPPRENPYTRTVISPVYEPRSPTPPRLSELTDRSATDALTAEINATPDVPDDLRAFLLHAAERHAVYRYDAIAEYYAHAPAHIQELMEASALIIIDFDDAIARGFVRLNEDLQDLYDTNGEDGPAYPDHAAL